MVVPCLDEALGIRDVIHELREVLPAARILVVDNGSSDDTVAVARAAGADAVVVEPRRGKAQAVLTAFELLDADLVVMLDGDASYPAEGARRLLESYAAQPVDMITGVRMAIDSSVFRPMHQLGTRAFERALHIAFGYHSRDLFSGLRLFSRRFYRNVPILSRGFELELELTIQAIDKGFSMAEVNVPFRSRAEGSKSKLRSVRDGVRILRFLTVLMRDYRPVTFFSAISALFFFAGLAAGSLPIIEFVETGLVGRFPLAFLAASLMVIAFFSLQTGLIIQGSLRYNREAFQARVRHTPDVPRLGSPLS